MKRSFRLLPVVLLLCAIPVSAQPVTLIDAGPVQQEDPQSIPVTKLKVHPAKEPVPALKYRLLPELRDLKPGNAVMSYYRSFSPEWQTWRKLKFHELLEKWEKDDMPPPELRFVLYENSLKEIDVGARRVYCDWEMLERLRKDGIGMLLSDIQSFREYIQLLAARARFQMLDRNLDDAVYTLQTSYTFSRHVSDGPTLIQSLVGLAMAMVTTGELERFIQQPGAPNMYWPLTDLPRPFIDMRKPLQGEKFFIDSLFPGWREMLNDNQAKPLSPKEIEETLKNFSFAAYGLGDFGVGKSPWEDRLATAVMAAAIYPKARQFLLDQGRPKKLVEQMPITQAVLMYEIHLCDRLYDDMAKWYNLPFAQMQKGVARAEKELKDLRGRSGMEGGILASLLLPAVAKVYEASNRIDRKFAGLRCVEAIRLYAAAHDGKLPASLKDIQEVPIPLDPRTENPFEYQLKGNTAILTAPPPAGEMPHAGNSWSFEITIVK